MLCYFTMKEKAILVRVSIADHEALRKAAYLTRKSINKIVNAGIKFILATYSIDNYKADKDV